MNAVPNIAVGIITRNSLSFCLHGLFELSQNGYCYEYEQFAEISGNQILFNGDYYDELDLVPLKTNQSGNFTLEDVTIGIKFHWERSENQTFSGRLRIIPEEGKLRAINILSVEEYLKSVISSEMSATSNIELLKAHAVISRSWVIAQLEKKERKICKPQISTTEIIRWYDHEDHLLFDVCADDHCQRYQGISRITASLVDQAVMLTYGELLTYNGKICDARFSKCCGGISEKFENCWDNHIHPYLQPIYDHPSGMQKVHIGMSLYLASETETLPVDLTQEKYAEAWIRNNPESFCNTQNKLVLNQVLNKYDQETVDFYRWKISYTQEELTSLINKHTGLYFGKIIDLIPLERGTSGRIIRLKIVGTQRSLIIGKELEIRKALSYSHLYSSAFVIDKELGEDNVPARFILTGAGWGHGVGLCQIGAAMMSENGYNYADILAHYFRGASLIKQYE